MLATIGVFDSMGVIESCNPDDACNDPEYGEVLVGSGIWNGSQLEIAAIMSVDLSDFNGPILNGAIDGNSVVLKVYRASEDAVQGWAKLCGALECHMKYT